LFTVLAAINAAGYDADLSSTANSSTRREVRDSIAARHPKSLEPIKRFFAAHRQKDWNAELNQYISFALTLGGPPDFQFQLKPNELPPDAAALTGFETLLPEFYQDANIENLWNRSRTAYDQAIQTYHGPVSAALLQANGYLRNPTSGYLGRRFQVFIDLLGAPNQLQGRLLRGGDAGRRAAGGRDPACLPALCSRSAGIEVFKAPGTNPRYG
jgi:hypothetical protein